MMWWYRDGMSGWGYVLLTVSTVVFWGVLIAGGIAVFRYLNRTPGEPGGGETRPTPEQLLAEGSPAAGSTRSSTGDAWTHSAARAQSPGPDNLKLHPCGAGGDGPPAVGHPSRTYSEETVTWMPVIRPPAHVRDVASVGPHSGRPPLFGQLLPDDRPSGPVAAGRGTPVLQTLLRPDLNHEHRPE
jgi:putative membrane protein